MKRACELCKRTARIHCESDQASLCWDCDAKVHSANFLVARHSRNLLCRLCQSPTPWSAAGSKLEPTFSDCRKCANRTCRDEKDGEGEDKEAEEEQEVVENQIVPWSPPPPPPASESSLSGGEAVATRKRGRIGNDRLTHSVRATEVASRTDSTISREIAPPPRKIGRTDPCGVEVRDSKSPVSESEKRLCEETVSSKEMAEYLTVNDGNGTAAVDLNLSLSLFSR